MGGDMTDVFAYFAFVSVLSLVFLAITVGVIADRLDSLNKIFKSVNNTLTKLKKAVKG